MIKDFLRQRDEGAAESQREKGSKKETERKQRAKAKEWESLNKKASVGSAEQMRRNEIPQARILEIYPSTI